MSQKQKQEHWIPWEIGPSKQNISSSGLGQILPHKKTIVVVERVQTAVTSCGKGTMEERDWGLPVVEGPWKRETEGRWGRGGGVHRGSSCGRQTMENLLWYWKIEFPLHQSREYPCSNYREKPRRNVCTKNSKKSPGMPKGKMFLEQQPHSYMVCQERLNSPLWQNQSQNLSCVFQQLFSHALQPAPLTVNMSFWSLFSWSLTSSRKPLLKED